MNDESQRGSARSAQARILSAVGVAAPFLAVIIFAVYRAHFGIDLGDEGFYLATPLRYALGDTPFRDEVTNPFRMFDLVLLPVFKFFPEISVLQLRMISVSLLVGSALALHMLMRRFAPPLLSALACTALAYYHSRILTPAYHLMGMTLFVVSWSFWLLGCLAMKNRSSAVAGVVSGAAAFLAALSYLPFLALLAVPTLVLIASSRTAPQRTSPRFVATLTMLVTVAVLVVGWIVALEATGLLEHWIEAASMLPKMVFYSQPISVKFQKAILSIGPFYVISILGVAGTVLAAHRVLVVLRFRRPRIGAGLLAGAVAVVVILLFIQDAESTPISSGESPFLKSPYYASALRVTLLAIGFHVAAFLLPAGDIRRIDRPQWSLVYWCMLSAGLTFALLQAVLSVHPHKMVWGALPIFASGAVALYRRFSDSLGGQAAGVGVLPCLVSICLAVAFAGAQVNVNRHYAQPSATEMTARFSHPRLAPIRSTPKFVGAIEATLDYLSDKVKAGDTLLAYDKIALMHFLTSTRPAMDSAWVAVKVFRWQMKRSIRFMIEGDRVPEYVVRMPRAQQHTVLDLFVRRNYEMVKKFDFLEVWQRKEGIVITEE